MAASLRERVSEVVYPRRHAPGPQGLPLVGSMFDFFRDPLAFITRIQREHGDVVEFTMAGKRIIQIAAPEHVKHVMQDHHRNYSKQTPVWDAIRDFLGDGLLTSENDFWLRQRRIMQPAFHRQRVASFVPLFAELTRETLDRLPHDRPFDVAREMMTLTLRIVGRALLSSDPVQDADEIGRALAVTLAYPDARLKTPVRLPLSVPLPMHRKFRAARAVLDRVVYRFIEERRRTGEDKGDLLSMLMMTTDADTGERMNDRQLRDEVMTIFLAGHETTGSALSWTIYLLSKHPDVRRKLNREVRDVLGDREPTLDDLPQLAYVKQVFQEAMRLYPPAWVTGRNVVEDDTIGGVHIPKGSIVQVSPYVTHRHPKHWPNPEGFDPDRFTADRVKERAPLAYIPFGAGPRVCIGNQFALMEAQIILAMLAQRMELDLVPGQTIVPAPSITLRPRDGIKVIARSRS
jgi:cytochrome P450